MGRMIPYFDGSTSYVALPVKFDYSNGITVEVRGISTSASNYQALFDDHDSSSSVDGTTLRYMGATKRIEYEMYNGSWKIASSQTIEPALAFHVAGVYDLSNMYVYANVQIS